MRREKSKRRAVEERECVREKIEEERKRKGQERKREERDGENETLENVAEKKMTKD